MNQSEMIEEYAEALFLVSRDKYIALSWNEISEEMRIEFRNRAKDLIGLGWHKYNHRDIIPDPI